MQKMTKVEAEMTKVEADKAPPFFDMSDRDDRIGIYLICVMLNIMPVAIFSVVLPPAWSPWLAAIAIMSGLALARKAVRVLAEH